MKSLSTLLLCSAALLSCAVAETKKVATFEDAINLYYQVIPLKKDPGSWLRYAPSKINDSLGYMMVDSGANRTIFNARFAHEAGIKIHKAGQVTGIGGNKAIRFKGKVNSILIAEKIGLKKGEYTFVDLGENEKVNIDGKELFPMGQLGFDILDQADLNVDFKKNRLLLPNPKKGVAGGLWGLLKQVGYKKIDLIKTKDACYIPVKVGDKEGFFLVDTASNQTVLYKIFTKGKNYPILKQGGVIQGVGGKKIPINIVTVNDFAFPGKRLQTPMLIVPQKNITMIHQKPVMGILGIPALDHLKMIMNFKRGQIYY